MQSLRLMLGVILAAMPGLAGELNVSPVPGAHSHNDYEHARPLLDALDQGFCSVEADIYLVDGRLLVAHDRSKVRPERTLEALYLDPLQARVRANGGRVFAGGPDFYLLIDFKTEAESTWQALQAVLERYAGMLTTFSTDRVQTNAVTVVMSGNSPRAAVANLPLRRAAIDGRKGDLEGSASARLVPWVSENWRELFHWRGEGEFTAAERTKLRNFVAQAHSQGRRIRFWGGPDVESIWREQKEAGVDFINTDRLADLRRFLLAAP